MVLAVRSSRLPDRDPVWNCDKLGAWSCILGMDVDVKQEMC